MARFAACLLATALALLLGACGDESGGGGGAPPAGDAGQAVNQAAARLDSMRSGRIDASLRFAVAFVAKQRLVITEKGAFANAKGTDLPHYDLEFSVAEDDATPQTSAVVFDGSALYVRPQGESSFVKRPASAIELNRNAYSGEQQALGSGRIPLLALTPGDWVDDARFAGESTVDGVPVRRITGTLDLVRFFADLRQAKANSFGLGLRLTGDATKLEDADGDATVKTKTIELLVGKTDGRLRRLRAHVDANVSNVPGDAAKELEDEVGVVQAQLDIDLTELDEPQTIAAPSAG